MMTKLEKLRWYWAGACKPITSFRLAEVGDAEFFD
jgi:hypothetical protein